MRTVELASPSKAAVQVLSTSGADRQALPGVPVVFGNAIVGNRIQEVLVRGSGLMGFRSLEDLGRLPSERWIRRWYLLTNDS